MESEHSQVLPGLAQMRRGLSRGCTSLSLNYFSNSAGTRLCSTTCLLYISRTGLSNRTLVGQKTLHSTLRPAITLMWVLSHWNVASVNVELGFFPFLRNFNYYRSKF